MLPSKERANEVLSLFQRHSPSFINQLARQRTYRFVTHHEVLLSLVLNCPVCSSFSSTSSSFSTVTTQRPSSHGSTSASTSLHLALTTTTTTSHPMTPTFGHAHHGGLFPHFPSFHPHPGALGYHGPPPGESPFPYPSNAPGFRYVLHMTSYHPPPSLIEEHLVHRGVGLGVEARAESCTLLRSLYCTFKLH